MATILRMPEVLANTTEAVIASWLVGEETAFVTGEPLAEIETEKALVELTAETDGVLGRLLARAGDATRVGAPIAVVITQGETAAEIDTLLAEDGAGFVGRPSIAVDQAPAATERASHQSAQPSGLHAGRIFSSPLARRLAREQGIDPGSLTGSGTNGRVIRQDVEAAIAGLPTVPIVAPVQAVPNPPHGSPSTEVPSGYTLIPHTGMRRAIARRLTESKSTVPHFYLTADCRVVDLLALRKQINEASSVKISVNDFVVKAVASAFQDVPEANVTWGEDALRRYENVDIAVAVATKDGLLTPVLRSVNQLSLSAVNVGIGELVERARAGRLRQEELDGGCFAVTNLGMYWTTEFSAILNPPQSGILEVGAAKPRAVVIDGELAAATVMRCTLSVDHRAIDGALAAQWLAALTARLENPISILV